MLQACIAQEGRLTLRGRDLRYGILDGVDIEVAEGEIVGLQGHSGTGKTTLARVLAGHVPAQSGEVTVGGAPLPTTGVWSTGFCPVQLIQQHPERAIDPRWRLNRVLEGVAPEVARRFGVEPQWGRRRASEVSGGQLQRFNISRAFDPRSRFIIADEITSMLDGVSQAQVWREMVELCRQRSLGLIVISHNEDILRKVCDRRLYLHHGVLTEEPYE